MRQAIHGILFFLLICLLPAMALAQDNPSPPANDSLREANGTSTIAQDTQLDTTENSAAAEAQIGESNRDTIETEDLDEFFQSLDDFTGASEAQLKGVGVCSRLKPIFTCVAYDGNQGGLCPPICHAPGGGCGSCEQDIGGTCHCYGY